MKFIKLSFCFLLCLVLVVLGIMFGIENQQEITITFFGSFQKITLIGQMPLWLAVGCSFIIGALLTFVVFLAEMIKLHLSMRRLKKELKSKPKTESEMADVTSCASEPAPMDYADVSSEMTIEDLDHPSESDDIL